MSAIVKVNQIHKRFGDNPVLKGVSFEVERGQMVAIIGASGSGKSTALRCIDRLETIDDGSIEVVTPPYEYMTVKETLEKAGFKPEFGEVTMKALNEAELEGEDAEKMQRLVDMIEALDDVQEVYTSAVFG